MEGHQKAKKAAMLREANVKHQTPIFGKENNQQVENSKLLNAPVKINHNRVKSSNVVAMKQSPKQEMARAKAGSPR